MTKFKITIRCWSKMAYVYQIGKNETDALIKWCNNYMSVAHTEIIKIEKA